MNRQNTVFKTKQNLRKFFLRRRVLCTAMRWKSSIFSVDKHSMGNDNKSFSHTASLKCLFLNWKDNIEGTGKNQVLSSLAGGPDSCPVTHVEPVALQRTKVTLFLLI